MPRRTPPSSAATPSPTTSPSRVTCPCGRQVRPIDGRVPMHRVGAWGGWCEHGGMSTKRIPFTKATPSPTTSSKLDLSRRFLLEVTRDGTVFIREACAPTTGGLPVYSVDTWDDAEALRVRHCRLARDRSGIYRLNEFSGEEEDLDRVGALFKETHERQMARRAASGDGSPSSVDEALAREGAW